MLTAFIEAHENAQKKINSFILMDDFDNNNYDQNGPKNLQTPEEIKVISESKNAV